MTDLEYSIKVQDIDHCGIVAGIIDRIGLVEIVNEKLGTHPLQTISPGITVKAMILNGLDLLSAPLYLISPIFCRKSHRTFIRRGDTTGTMTTD